jgi:hypothetical protein
MADAAYLTKWVDAMIQISSYSEIDMIENIRTCLDLLKKYESVWVKRPKGKTLPKLRQLRLALGALCYTEAGKKASFRLGSRVAAFILTNAEAMMKVGSCIGC